MSVPRRKCAIKTKLRIVWRSDWNTFSSPIPSGLYASRFSSIIATPQLVNRCSPVGSLLCRAGILHDFTPGWNWIELEFTELSPALICSHSRVENGRVERNGRLWNAANHRGPSFRRRRPRSEWNSPTPESGGPSAARFQSFPAPFHRFGVSFSE